MPLKIRKAIIEDLGFLLKMIHVMAIFLKMEIYVRVSVASHDAAEPGAAPDRGARLPDQMAIG